MKRYIIIMLLIISNYALAQKLSLKDPLTHSGSVNNSECPSYAKGKKCAKVIIELNVPDVKITNNALIIGEVTHETGRYEFYIKPEKNKQKAYVTLDTGNGAPFQLFLLTNDGKALVGNESYIVKVGRDHSADADQAILRVNTIPSGATIYIDDERWENSEDLITAKEKHSLRIEKQGYLPIDTVIFAVPNQELDITKQLESNRVQLTVTSDVKNTTVKIDDGPSVNLKYKGTIPYGAHELVCEGKYKSKDNNWHYFKEQTKSFSVDENTPKGKYEHKAKFTGELNVVIGNYGRRPRVKIKETTNAREISIHKESGKNVTFEGLYGTYNVTVKSTGCRTVSQDCTIDDGETHTLPLTMQKTADKWVLISYRALARSPFGLMIGGISKRKYWGFYAAGGLNSFKSLENKHYEDEEYLNGIKSFYVTCGAIYNPNSWLNFNLGIGGGSYYSYGYHLKNDELVKSKFDPMDKFGGVCAEAGVMFSLGPVILGGGYNIIIDVKNKGVTTPNLTNIYLTAGLRL